MRLILYCVLFIMQQYNCYAQDFILYNPPQNIVDLKIGKYDSVLVLVSSDTTRIGKKVINPEILFLNLKDFLFLFKDSNQIIVNGFEIKSKNNKIVYDYNLPFFSQLRIAKNNKTNFSFFESYLFYKNNTDSFDEKEVIKYNIQIVDNNILINIDKKYYKNRFKINQNFQSLINEYNLYKSKNSFITKDWEKVTSSNINKLQQLSQNLTFAALNGCEECIKLIEKYRQTFDVMNFGMLSEQFGHSEVIIRKIKNAP